MSDLTRLIGIGRTLLAADRDVENLRKSCVRNRMTDTLTVKLMTTRRGLLFGPLRMRLEGEAICADDLALLRCFQEIALMTRDAQPSELGHWGEVAGRLDDVISAVDEAFAADVAAGRRAAA